MRLSSRDFLCVWGSLWPFPPLRSPALHFSHSCNYVNASSISDSQSASNTRHNSTLWVFLLSVDSLTGHQGPNWNLKLTGSVGLVELWQERWQERARREEGGRGKTLRFRARHSCSSNKQSMKFHQFCCCVFCLFLSGERTLRLINTGRKQYTQTLHCRVAAPTYPMLKDLIPVGFCSFGHISVGLKNGHGSLCVGALGSQ